MQSIITNQDLENMYLETEHGMFTPIYDFKSYDNETETYQGFRLVKTAEEVYQEWLENKDKQIDICPTKTVEERLEEAEQRLAEKDQENKMLKAQVEANASSYEFLESCIMEMAEKVYA